MTAILWKDVDRDIDWARLHFSKAVELFGRMRPDEEGPDYFEAMAFMHAMQSGYTSFESAMRRLLSLLEEPIPMGAEWHKDLVERIIRPLPDRRPAILAEKTLARAVGQLRGFRHVATHVYNEFDPDRAALAVKAADTFLVQIGSALTRFRAIIDPD